MARRCPFRSSGSCPVTSSSISSTSRPSPHWSGARATVALTRSMGCPCCSSKGWLPARSGRASRRWKPRCGRRWNEPCWDALAREPSPPGAGVGACRRRDRRRPELPVTLACADRGDRVRAVTPGDAAHAGSRRPAVLSVRPAARPPAAVVHRFRLRGHPGAGSGLRPEDALHPRPGDVSQLGDRLGAGLSDTLDRLRHLAVAGLANRPRRRVDRRRRFLAALPWRAIRVWHGGVRVWRRQTRRVHRDGDRPLESADGPRPALRRVSGRVCGDNSAHHSDPRIERGGSLRPVPGHRDPDHPLYPATMNAHDLLPGERILVSSARHWVVLVRPTVTTVLAIAVSLVILVLLPIPGELRILLMLGVLLAGLVVLNLYYWGWRAHEYVLTDQRVILNEGIISRFSRSIAIDRIQDLTTFQGIWGRTWGFGDIELESAGRDSAEVLSMVPRPQRLDHRPEVSRQGPLRPGSYRKGAHAVPLQRW